MLRNVDRISNASASWPKIASLIEGLAVTAENLGADSSEACFTYETPDCEHDDLVPFIRIGVARVQRSENVTSE
jgi:hypothetical protein